MTVIVDYGAGNTRSVMNTLNRLGVDYVLTSDIATISNSERLILPGVGHAEAAMTQLKNRGLVDVLKNYKKPFLGICLGMQLMFEYSEEGDTKCLGLIPGQIKKFLPNGTNKVPHMGWNDFSDECRHFVFGGLNSKETAYFVHSYYAEVCDHTISICDYIVPFSAAVAFNNFVGIQFHPEKSGTIGQTILNNFIKYSSE